MLIIPLPLLIVVLRGCNAKGRHPRSPQWEIVLTHCGADVCTYTHIAANVTVAMIVPTDAEYAGASSVAWSLESTYSLYRSNLNG